MKLMIEKTVSASTDKLAAQIVEKAFVEGKPENLWNPVLDEIVGGPKFNELNDDKVLTKNYSDNNHSYRDVLKNQKDKEVIDSFLYSTDISTEIQGCASKAEIIICTTTFNDCNSSYQDIDDKIWHDDNDHSCQNPGKKIDDSLQQTVILKEKNNNNKSNVFSKISVSFFWFVLFVFFFFFIF